MASTDDKMHNKQIYIKHISNICFKTETIRISFYVSNLTDLYISLTSFITVYASH